MLQLARAILEPLLKRRGKIFELRLGLLLIVDIGVGADPAPDGAIPIVRGNGAGQMPAKTAVTAFKANLGMKVLTRLATAIP